MEDDKIKELFKEFQPELTSSHRFLTALQKNMEAVEIVKQCNVENRKRNRVAVVIAALAGVAVGMLLSLLVPLADYFSVSLPHIQIRSLTVDATLIAWVIAGGAAVAVALKAYEAAMSGLALRSRVSASAEGWRAST